LAFTGIELGLYVSFTGILTFKKSDDLRAIANDLPADRILVETDSPYLAPGKFRGKRCEPAYVVETARVLADPQKFGIVLVSAPDPVPVPRARPATRRRRPWGA